MPSNFTNLVVTWFKEDFNYATSKDITNFVQSIPLFTDAGGGEVNEAQIVLSGAFGQFISDEISSETVIEEFDRFRIEVTDLAGNIYDRFFELKPSFLPTQTKAEGTLLTLDLIGTEYHTQEIHFNRAFWFADAFEVAREIGEGYQTNRGARQPNLIGHDIGYSQVSKFGNGLPKSTVNHYEYGLHPDYVFNYWTDIGDKLGGSVDTGGILDFFDTSFDTPSIDEINIAIFSQGSRTNDFLDDSSLPTLDKDDTDNVNVGEQEGGINPPTGSLICSWGSPKRGSLPTGHSIYESGIFQFVFRPLFDTNVTYLTDAKVIDNEKHFISIQDNNQGNTPDVSPLFWTQIDMADEFGNTTQYSEWTDGKTQAWINCGSNHTDKPSVTDGITTYLRGTFAPDPGNPPAGTFEFALAPGMFDCNVVINDNNTTDGEGFFRTWVDARATDDTELGLVADIYAYSGQINLFPRGFRILVDGTGSDTFSGTDPIGVVYTNNIAEFDGDGNWFVKYRPANFGSDLNNMQVAVIDDGVVWFWDSSAVQWKIQTGDMAHECFHVYDSLTNTASFDPKPTETDFAEFPDVTKAGGTFGENIDSAITVNVDTDSLIIKNRITEGGNVLPNSSYNQFGNWLCLRFPFSPANTGSASVGDIYGTASPSANFPGLEPSTLTTQNMDFTSRGNFGYTHPESIDYGQLQSLAGVMKIEAFRGTIDFDGVKEVRVCLFDIVDNVVFADFEVPFVNTFFPFDLPISSFSIYRGRKPVYFSLSGNDIVDLKLPKELSLQNQFEWRNIKLMTMHLTLGYDRFQRYSPEAKGLTENPDFDDTSLIKMTGANLSMSVDDLHFTKPLLAIAGFDTVIRVLTPEFLERTHISLFDQLLNDARAELEKQQFEHTQYDIRTSGSRIFDFRYGDGFFFKSNVLTDREDDSDQPGSKNVKLVVERLEFAITSPGTGVGGLSRRIVGSRRFV
jgi:hypothetical protein